MVVDLLKERHAFGAAVSVDGQIEQDVFRGGMMDQILERPAVDLKILRRVLARINDGGDAAGGAQFFGSRAASQRPRKSSQRYRFHCKSDSHRAGQNIN